jgi:putative DNA primase/helicase
VSDEHDDQQYMTDVGNCQRLTRRRGHAMRHCKPWGRWLVHRDDRWRIDDTDLVTLWAKESARSIFAEALAQDDPDLRDKLIRHAQQSESGRAIEAAIKLARSEPGIPVLPEELDADNYLLGQPTGEAVNLKTGELLPPDPRRLITKSTAARYDPAAPAPQWESFLDRVMDGSADLIGYLQRIAGICLTGDATVQEFWIFHGSGANGKSCFLDTFKYVLGDYAASAPESLLTVRKHDEHPTEIMDLHKLRCLVASETEEGAKLKIGFVKRSTGDDTLKGRRMRENFTEFPRTHKTIMVTNNKPVIRRRIRLIPFTVVIPDDEQDRQLPEKLKAEGPGILAWAVRGCLEWQRGGLRTPAEVMIATQNYQAESDPLTDYLAERFVRGAEGFKVTRNDLYTDYLSWCSQTGEKHPMDRTVLYDHIRRVPGVNEATWKLGKAPQRGFRGLGLKAVYESEAAVSE